MYINHVLKSYYYKSVERCRHGNYRYLSCLMCSLHKLFYSNLLLLCSYFILCLFLLCYFVINCIINVT